MEGSKKKYRTLRIIAFPEICTHNKMKQTDNVRGGLDQNNNYNNDKLAQWRSVCSGTFRKYGKTKPFLRSHSWQEKKSKKKKQTNKLVRVNRIYEYDNILLKCVWSMNCLPRVLLHLLCVGQTELFRLNGDLGRGQHGKNCWWTMAAFHRISCAIGMAHTIERVYMSLLRLTINI